jgi:hypothetical protein
VSIGRLTSPRVWNSARLANRKDLGITAGGLVSLQHPPCIHIYWYKNARTHLHGTKQTKCLNATIIISHSSRIPDQERSVQSSISPTPEVARNGASLAESVNTEQARANIDRVSNTTRPVDRSKIR